MKKPFVALDLGTTVGWAQWTGEHLVHGNHSLATKRHESAGMRLIKFEELLGSLIADKIELIVYEQPGHQKSLAASEVLHGMSAILNSFCLKKGINYYGVPVSHIKKAATGKGNANKELVRIYAEETCAKINGTPAALDDDNESDAVALACAYLEGLL